MVREDVFEDYPNADISGSIIWIPILEKDNLNAALPSTKTLNDKRVHHFYDDRKIAGKIIADSVGWKGNVAWDIYLFYSPNVKWAESLPEPNFWVHQLRDDWATKRTFRTGMDLKIELAATMRILFSK